MLFIFRSIKRNSEINKINSDNKIILSIREVKMEIQYNLDLNESIKKDMISIILAKNINKIENS